MWRHPVTGPDDSCDAPVEGHQAPAPPGATTDTPGTPPRRQHNTDTKTKEIDEASGEEESEEKKSKENNKRTEQKGLQKMDTDGYQKK